MRERMQELRKALHLTQQEFADRLNVSRANIAGYEIGRRVPSDAVISLICREFNVSESWLRSGEGEMLVEMSRDEQIAAFVGSVLRDEKDSFKRRLIAVLSALDESEWQVLENLAKKISGTNSVPPNNGTDESQNNT